MQPISGKDSTMREALVRKFILALASVAFLAGCASMFQSAYDERSEQQCEEENHGRDRLDCR